MRFDSPGSGATNFLRLLAAKSENGTLEAVASEQLKRSCSQEEAIIISDGLNKVKSAFNLFMETMKGQNKDIEVKDVALFKDMLERARRGDDM